MYILKLDFLKDFKQSILRDLFLRNFKSHLMPKYDNLRFFNQLLFSK